jgi:hypothetical protein
MRGGLVKREYKEFENITSAKTYAEKNKHKEKAQFTESLVVELT